MYRGTHWGQTPHWARLQCKLTLSCGQACMAETWDSAELCSPVLLGGDHSVLCTTHWAKLPFFLFFGVYLSISWCNSSVNKQNSWREQCTTLSSYKSTCTLCCQSLLNSFCKYFSQNFSKIPGSVCSRQLSLPLHLAQRKFSLLIYVVLRVGNFSEY